MPLLQVESEVPARGCIAWPGIASRASLRAAAPSGVGAGACGYECNMDIGPLLPPGVATPNSLTSDWMRAQWSSEIEDGKLDSGRAAWFDIPSSRSRPVCLAVLVQHRKGRVRAGALGEHRGSTAWPGPALAPWPAIAGHDAENLPNKRECLTPCAQHRCHPMFRAPPTQSSAATTAVSHTAPFQTQHVHVPRQRAHNAAICTHRTRTTALQRREDCTTTDLCRPVSSPSPPPRWAHSTPA